MEFTPTVLSGYTQNWFVFLIWIFVAGLLAILYCIERESRRNQDIASQAIRDLADALEECSNLREQMHSSGEEWKTPRVYNGPD